MIARLCLLLLMLSCLLRPAQAELRPPEQVFIPQLRFEHPQQLRLQIRIEPGYYLYRDRFAATLDGQPVSLTLPAGETKDDPSFGRVQVYHKSVEILLPLSQPLTGPAQLQIRSQGCSETYKVCFPPHTRKWQLRPGGIVQPLDSKLPGLLGANTNAAPSAALSFPSAQHPVSLWLTLGGFFLAGVLMAATVCMYPLIPIVSALIIGQHGETTRRARSFWLSMAYVQGLAISYTLAGLAAGSLGLPLTLWLQQPWVIASFALLMVLLALSLFGLYELQLPSGWQTRFNAWSNRMPGGRFLPVLVMGALSALIVGPCATPALAAALLFIAKSGDLWLGGLALYAMALGVGTPLLLIGVFGGHILPKTGAWMLAVKQLFGTLMLLVALWMASPILPPRLLMLLLATLLIVSAIYLSALDPLPAHNASGWRKLWKGLGVVLLVIGITQLLGAASGADDFRKPLGGLFRSAQAAPAPTLSFHPVQSPAELDQLRQQHPGQPVLLDFYADWCSSCIEMEHETFSDPAVQRKLQGVLLVRADVTANLPGHRALLARFGLFGPPGIILYDRSGQAQPPLIGFMPPETFIAALRPLEA